MFTGSVISIEGGAVDAANVYADTGAGMVPVAVSDAAGAFVADVPPGASMEARRVGFGVEPFTAPAEGRTVTVEMIPDTLPDLTVTPDDSDSDAGFPLLLLVAAAVALSR